MNKSRKEVSDYKSKDIYKYYKTTTSEPVTLKQFMLITKLFFQKIVSKIYRGSVIKLPSDFGHLGVGIKNLKIVLNNNGEIDVLKSNLTTNWKKTRELWEKKPNLKHKQYVYFENLHTEGKRPFIKWIRLHTRIPCLMYYQFTATRSFKRGLASFIKTNPNQEYYDF